MTATGDHSTYALDAARLELGLSRDELWLRYAALGGNGSSIELEAFLVGILKPSPHDHDVIALALNERFVELGQDHPVPYLADRASQDDEKGTT